MCRGGESEIRQIEEIEATDVSAVEEGEDRMSEEEAGDEVDWRVKAGPRNRSTQKEREGARSNTRAVQRLVHTCMMGRGRTHHHGTKQ